MSVAPMLILVTVVSVLVAAASSIVLMRWRREERLRSEARVALLRDLAADHDDLRLRADDSANADRPQIFQAEREPSPWLRRALAAGSVAALVVTIGWAWSVMPVNTPAPAASSATAHLPLELLSLRHAQEKDAFTVTGLVQNPRGSSQLRSVEATVLLFDSRGTMLTSGRAPLDFTALGAGDESPFLIRVPVTTAVARYRVGFRDADGQVLGHVDRRHLESIAQRQEP
jgi:hypothetical protein